MADAILGIDCVGEGVLITCGYASDTNPAVEFRADRKSSERLDTLVRQVRGSRSLSSIVCVRGPGSFTGIRTGLAFGKGLSIALDIPLYTISSYHLALDTDLNARATALRVPANKREFFRQAASWKSANRTAEGLPLSELAKELSSSELVLVGESELEPRSAFDTPAQSRAQVLQTARLLLAWGLLAEQLRSAEFASFSADYGKEPNAATLEERGISRRNPLNP